MIDISLIIHRHMEGEEDSGSYEDLLKPPLLSTSHITGRMSPISGEAAPPVSHTH